MPLVSVIIPVYNVENYLTECLQSILSQTFTDFEVIIIDDGSVDDSAAICDYFAKVDDRVIVRHIKNHGPAYARNIGIQLSRGSYIMFCDSDDYVEKEWIAHFLECITPNKDNFIFGGFQKVYLDGSVVDNRSSIVSIMNTDSVDRFLDLHYQSIAGFPWNALYYKDVLTKWDIRFPENSIVEDFPFVLEYASHMNYITFTGYSDNYYRIDNRETVSKKYSKYTFRRWEEKYTAIHNYIINHYSDIVQQEMMNRLASNYLYLFLQSLENTFDSQNKDSVLEKLKYNQQVVNSDIFQNCLTYADSSKENKVYISLLKSRMYYIAYIYQTLGRIKALVRRI